MPTALPVQLLIRCLPGKSVGTPLLLLGVLGVLCGGLQAQSTSNDTTSGSTLTISNSTTQDSTGVITLNSDSPPLTNDTVTSGSSLILSSGMSNSPDTSQLTTTGTINGTLVVNSGSTLTLNGSTTSMTNGFITSAGSTFTLNTGTLSIGTLNTGTLSLGTVMLSNNGAIMLGTTTANSVVSLTSGGTLNFTGLSDSGIVAYLSLASSGLGGIQLGNDGYALRLTSSSTATQSSGTVCVAALGSVPAGNSPSSASFAAPSVTLVGMGNLGGQNIAERGVVYSLSTISSSPMPGASGVIKVAHTGNPDSTGGFSLTADGLAANTTYSYRVYATDSTGATVLSQPQTFTTPTVLQNWRQTFFGSIAGTGSGADNADPDGDGVPNLIEFATGKNPTASTPASAAISHNGGSMEYTYTRSLDALNSGVTFSVEWNDTLNPTQWSNVGVIEEVLSNDGLIQQVKATLPASPSGRRFVRLKVLPPADAATGATN